MSVEATFYKTALIMNLVILFVLFCASEPLDLFFQQIFLFILICMLFRLLILIRRSQ